LSDFDTSGLRQLDQDLGKVEAQSLPQARKVVARGSVQIKKGAQQRIAGHPHAPAYPRSIGYDQYETPGWLRSQIGPDKLKRQGALGNILELGTTNNAPLPHLGPAADEEAPKFERAVGDLGVSLLEDNL